MASVAADIFIGKFVAILESEAASIAGGGHEILLRGCRWRQQSTHRKANDVEHIIDEFMYHMYEQQSGGPFARWINKTIHFPKKLWYKRL
ncbi:hypothetical protein L3X38_033871 [Prunus dulcis]|uniref:Uncharacterized protein n=1 Tax=Prunus dulcis TaxID=3755 RepID=A0AAD4VH19_PRUDU|nr:hypothetical protein L3X38_033871 [Prunus dulcis]